jgi:hypothetical protein
MPWIVMIKGTKLPDVALLSELCKRCFMLLFCVQADKWLGTAVLEDIDARSIKMRGRPQGVAFSLDGF